MSGLAVAPGATAQGNPLSFEGPCLVVGAPAQVALRAWPGAYLLPIQDLDPEAEAPSLDDLHTPLDEPDGDEGASLPPSDAAPGDADGETPDAMAALDRLFDELATAGDDAQAQMRARRIQMVWLQSGSDTVDLLMRRAGIALQQEDFTLALDLLDVVTTLEPDYAEGWNRRATVFYMQSDLSRSLADIERTLSLEPRHWGALSGLALIQRKLGQTARAMETFRQVLAIHPGLSDARDALEELEAANAGQEI